MRSIVLAAVLSLMGIAAHAQQTDVAKSKLQAAETLADQLLQQIDTELSGFGPQLACQARCQFLDANGVCRRKLVRTEQEQRMRACSWPSSENLTERQNVDVFMCNERIPRNDWTTINPCPPPPAYATTQSCGQSNVFRCGKYHCATVWANLNCSNLLPGQSCIGAGTFDDGYITLNANCWWCMQGNANGCCPTGCI